MQELIDTVAAKVGLSPEVATKAVGTILGFLAKEGPEDAVNMLLDKTEGARELLAASADGGGGGLMGMMGGMMGGGLMGLGAKLMGMGLSMDQIKQVSVELFKTGKKSAGEDTMGEIIGAIPGLSSFI